MLLSMPDLVDTYVRGCIRASKRRSRNDQTTVFPSLVIRHGHGQALASETRCKGFLVNLKGQASS